MARTLLVAPLLASTIPAAYADQDPGRRQEGLRHEDVAAPHATLSPQALDQLRTQIQNNWILPASALATDKTDLTVVVVVELDPDGNVLSATVDDPKKLTDPISEAIARNIIRAVEKASPISGLPPTQFAAWRKTRLSFNLREFLGR